MEIDISRIIVNGRHRKDLGDVGALAESIRTVGLLHPLVVTPDNQLVAGARRLEALRSLGRKKAPVHVVQGMEDTLLALTAERDENSPACRKDFALSEAVALGEALEAMERPETESNHRERSSEGGKKSGATRRGETKGGKNCPTLKRNESKRTTAKVGKAIGLSRITYERAKAIVKAAAAEPKTFAPLKEEMDKKGKVNGCYERMKTIKAERERKKLSGSCKRLKNGVRCGDFRTVLADLADESVNLIFTDPPYDKASIPLYGDLAQLAERVLAPGGSLVCYAAQYALPSIFPLMTPHLRYQWAFAVRHSGGQRRMHGWRVRVGWKPLLWFVKDHYQGEYLLDLLDSEPGDKVAHEWAQGCGEAAYLIENLCPKDGLVLDPMVGSGTTLMVALRLGREFLGVEIDKERAKVASTMLTQEAKLKEM